MNTKPSVLESFFSNYPLLSFEPGEHLKRPHEKCQLVRYIKTGHIRFHNYTMSGKEISFIYLAPEHYKNIVFGYHEKLDTYYVTALTKAKHWTAPKKEFVAFLQKNPAAAIELAEGLYDFISNLAIQNAFVKSGDSQLRIASFLLEMYKFFAKDTDSGKKVTIFQLTHQMIADQTGLTRETVSLQLMKLKKEGIIDYDNGFIVFHKVEALKQKTQDIISE